MIRTTHRRKLTDDQRRHRSIDVQGLAVAIAFLVGIALFAGGHKPKQDVHPPQFRAVEAQSAKGQSDRLKARRDGHVSPTLADGGHR